jgi:hypothetical protein
MNTPQKRKAEPFKVEDPAAAMARTQEFARRVLSVPKSAVPSHLPTKRVKRTKRKPDA